MATAWLLDSVALGDNLEPLAKAVRDSGCELKIANRPKPPYTWDDVDYNFLSSFPADHCVVVSGDIDMVERVRDAGIWTPAVFADVEKYFCTSYYPIFGDNLLNREYVMLPFGDLFRRRSFLFNTVGVDGKVFIRPDSPLKSFTGQILGDVTFEKDLEYLAFHEPLDSDVVAVCVPKSIEAEWRFVVVDGIVVAGSLYKRKLVMREEAVNDGSIFDYAQSIVAETEFSPERVWILDVCQTTCGKLHVIEVGGFSFAGLYACDKMRVVSAVSAVASELHRQRSG